MAWSILAVTTFRQFPCPLPPGIDPHVPTTFESWFGLFMSFWIFFGVVLLILPRYWSDAIIRLMFPFMPRRLEDLDGKK
jgi:hypothetical protein